jgi:PA14 domain
MLPSQSISRVARIVVTGCILFPALLRSALAIVDLNSNGMSDVWELKYNASALLSNVDTDGDGQNALAESIPGTNPFDPNDVFKITTLSQAASNVTLTWPSLLGKRYQVQSATNLTQTVWTNEGNLLPGVGGPLTATIPSSVSQKLFRVVVTDVDTDGDGLTDWEELQLGLDPTKISTLGNGTNDLALVEAALVSTNVISIQETTPAAFQDGLVPGTFTVTRTGNINPITVHYTVSGIATTNDYQQLSGLVAIPLGYSNSVTINVVPLPSNMLSPRSVTVSLATNNAYALASSSNATVIVYNSTLPTGTGLLGQYFDNASSTYSNPTNFTNLKVTRVDPTIDFILGTNGWPDVTIQSNTFSIRWTGQVQPEFSEPYTFDARTDDGVKLWVNDQLVIDDWRTQTVTDSNSAPINLQAGVRYDIKMEYFQNTGSAEAHLTWYSPSQVKEIIP